MLKTTKRYLKEVLKAIKRSFKDDYKISIISHLLVIFRHMTSINLQPMQHNRIKHLVLFLC